MVKICHLAKIPVLATAPLNAAANAILNNLERNDRNARHGVRPSRFAGETPETGAILALYRAYHNLDVPDDYEGDEEAMREDNMLARLTTADNQHHSKRFAGLLDRSSLHCQILEDTGVLGDGGPNAAMRYDAIDGDPYSEFRRLFQDPDAPIYAADLPEEEDGPVKSSVKTYGARAEDTIAAEPTEPAPRQPTLSSVTKGILEIAVSRASCTLNI